MSYLILNTPGVYIKFFLSNIVWICVAVWVT